MQDFGLDRYHCNLFEWKQICARFLIICLVYVSLYIQLSTGRVGIPLIDLSPQDLDFQRHMSWSFICVFSELM